MARAIHAPVSSDPANGEGTRQFQQIHIDAARNATDDFNPFHDPRKSGLIRGNPYEGTIVLGFQLECLIAAEIDRHRRASGENAIIEREALHYRNYQLTFADALRPGQAFGVQIKPTLAAADPASLSNRVVVRSARGLVMIGHVRDTGTALYGGDADVASFAPLRDAPDRAYVDGTRYFLKRKFMNTGNAKNFLAGSLCDQGEYFDELADRVTFPDLFPVALLSCALLEKAMHGAHDFLANPMVYVSHAISVDRRLARGLRSNDALHMLVAGPAPVEADKGLGRVEAGMLRFTGVGVVGAGGVLYRADVLMAPLESIARAE
ncbi:MAG: hypothetical protein ABI533_04045 [Betaproteobacteria bacterium]